jgi:hypothetical protein
MSVTFDILRQLLGFLCTWAVIGYFVIQLVKVPNDKKAAKKILIMSGPLCWGIFFVTVLMERKSTRCNHL